MGHWRLSALLLLAACGGDPPLRTVADFDAQRYLGTWHEIAAIPAWFQRHCASDTEAVYADRSPRPARSRSPTAAGAATARSIPRSVARASPHRPTKAGSR